MSIRVSSPGDNGPVTQTSTAPSSAPTEASGEETWLWVWTFTWCGETTEITTAGGAGTGLEWLWGWTWYRECEDAGSGDTASESSPAPSPPSPLPAAPKPSAAPTSSGQAPSASVEVLVAETVSGIESLVTPVWPSLGLDPSDWTILSPLPLTPFGDDSVLVAPWPGTPIPLPVDVSVDVVAPTVVPTIGQPRPPAPPTMEISSAGGTVAITITIGADTFFPTSQDPNEPQPAPRRHAPGPDTYATESARVLPRATVVVASSQALASPARAQQPQPAAQAGAGASSRGSSRGPLPFDLPPLQAAGSSAAGSGGGASSLLVFGFAAVIGFFVLAVPGLGRRIRLARLPSPRGRYGSSIDRPG